MTPHAEAFAHRDPAAPATRPHRGIGSVRVASGAVDAEEQGIQRRRRFGAVFAAVWAIYLIDPLRKGWALDDPVARVYTLAVIVAFAACYIWSYWLLMRGRPSSGSWPPNPEPRTVLIPLLAQAALILAASVTLYSEVLGMSIYLASYIAFATPVRWAIPLELVVMVAAGVVPQLATGRPPDYGLIPSLALAGFAVGGVRVILMRNHQLYLARKQLTELAVAEERLRVGRDVHDILGHSLTVITVKTELAQRLIDIDPERARSEMADVERLAREALSGVRTTVGGLREVSLAGELANARTALRAAEIDAELPDSDDLPIRHSVVFGWVLREAVTNVVRHSGAAHCWVRVTATSIEVSDDGVGMGESARVGSGLSGLRERVRATGGALTLANRPEGGLRVLASFPATIKEPE
ncbi:sensor histidine kinase [Nocardia aurantiaca]|uniref:Sensor histidine kinase n=1 Tax=Nocardia aurantiaca TaxID=2675850 RepID=A0A6I3KY22_9NOCA|nr:sensor histidine kinase [Nocardia aurantiaca]MTE12399.1 sensor histidine kinase [Nocardia aurantiaca]